jgi:hypothetical protein
MKKKSKKLKKDGSKPRTKSSKSSKSSKSPKSPKSSKSPKSLKSSKSSKSSKSPKIKSYNDYYSKLNKINTAQDLIKLNKCCLCNNDTFLLTQEPYDKINGQYIPLYYQEKWVCFSFNEIFDLLYNNIVKNGFKYIPDPIHIYDDMSKENVKIISIFDKIFNNNKIKKALENNIKNDDIFRILETNDLIVLFNIYDRLKEDKNLAVNLFIFWYNDIKPSKLSFSIENFIVKSYDGNKIRFGLLLDKYINDPFSDCSKDIQLAVKSFLEFIRKEFTQKSKQLSPVLEQDEE